MTYLKYLIHVSITIAFLADAIADTKPSNEEYISQLKQIITKADRITVAEGGASEKRLLYLFTSNSNKDIIQFANTLSAIPEAKHYLCYCVGGPTVRFYNNENIITSVTIHHGDSIECPLWGKNMKLRDCENLIKWFDERKITQPREEFEYEALIAKEADEFRAKWKSSMPKSILPFYGQTEANGTPFVSANSREAIIREFPEPYQRALKLFTWFGAREETPIYSHNGLEVDASQFILDIPAEQLISSTKTNDLTPNQIRGARRLFECAGFHSKQFGKPDYISESLRQKLIDILIKRQQ